MKFSRSKWFAYTLLVGLTPVLTRLLTWFVASSDLIEPVVATDLITFGLVLHASVINELEHLAAKDHEWKSTQSGIAIAFITLYGALYALAVFGDKVEDIVDRHALLGSALLFAGLSMAHTIATVRHLVMRSSK